MSRTARLKPKSRYRHMNPEIAERIRKEYVPRVVTQKILGERYNLRQHSVSRIISRQTW